MAEFLQACNPVKSIKFNRINNKLLSTLRAKTRNFAPHISQYFIMNRL
jgi:hypothetical protein